METRRDLHRPVNPQRPANLLRLDELESQQFFDPLIDRAAVNIGIA